jgi:hypothetical protein
MPPPSPTAVSPSLASRREQNETLTAYLMRRLSLQETIITDLESEKKGLQEKNDFYNATQEDLNLLVKEIGRQFENSERQVTYLRCLMTHKVDALTIELEARKLGRSKL